MNKKFVVSRNLEWVDYKKNIEKLIIGFISGRVYEYYNVSISRYEELMKVSSHGGYFRRYIQGHYREKRIR